MATAKVTVSLKLSKMSLVIKKEWTFLLACHLQAPAELTDIRIPLQISSYKWLQSELTFDKCRNTDLGALPESSVAVSVTGLDVKLLLLPVARMHTLVGSGSSSPAWLISLCDGGASAEGVDVVPKKVELSDRYFGGRVGKDSKWRSCRSLNA